MKTLYYPMNKKNACVQQLAGCLSVAWLLSTPLPQDPVTHLSNEQLQNLINSMVMVMKTT